MQRRSALGRLAATLAGLSLFRRLPVVAAQPATNWPRLSPAEIAKWTPRSTGSVECPQCHEWTDELGGFTLCGICLDCATKADPSPTTTPRSALFWLLPPDKIGQVEIEIRRLHQEADRLDKTIPNDWTMLDNEEEVIAEIQRLDREALLLALLRAASLQLGSASI